MIDHAGELTEQLELALSMLSIACDLLAQVTGKERGFVVYALRRAANIETAPISEGRSSAVNGAEIV